MPGVFTPDADAAAPELSLWRRVSIDGTGGTLPGEVPSEPVEPLTFPEVRRSAEEAALVGPDEGNAFKDPLGGFGNVAGG